MTNDTTLIAHIATRANEIERRARPSLVRPKIDWMMDLAAAHETCPLDLERLLAFADSDFVHDVFGIERHLNRQSGHLGGCFLPRCAAR